jgi:hypothetical protein
MSIETCSKCLRQVEVTRSLASGEALICPSCTQAVLARALPSTFEPSAPTVCRTCADSPSCPSGTPRTGAARKHCMLWRRQ